jgi:ubiquinone/menaquinone biosynthesis C-methylase UbiE
MEFANVYDDARRAKSYAGLEFPATYYLAFRDLPEIIGNSVTGKKALDFGCGAGRSTRFLRNLGFKTVGIDIAGEMIRKARDIDPAGDYRLVGSGDFGSLGEAVYDLVLSAFTFDNIPTMDMKVAILTQLRNLVRGGGTIINLVSSPDMYTHEWVSISTRDFPENRRACDGDVVKTIITATGDFRPVEDVLCSDTCYRVIYKRAGLDVAGMYAPLAREDEPYPWVNETRVAPWVIYVLKRARR